MGKQTMVPPLAALLLFLATLAAPELPGIPVGVPIL
jgi:hypothetical protein